MGKEYRWSYKITYTFIHMEIKMFHPGFQIIEVVIHSFMALLQTIQLFQYLVLVELYIIHICSQFVVVFIPVIANDFHIDLDTS